MRSALLVLVLLSACRTNPELCAGGSPGLEIGVGENDFRATPPGATVTPEFGPQGGWHVWTALSVTGLTLPADGEVVAHLVATTDAGFDTGADAGDTDAAVPVVADSLPYLNPRCDKDSGALRAWGIQFRFFPTTPVGLFDRDVDVKATITLDDGTTFQGATTWRIGASE